MLSLFKSDELMLSPFKGDELMLSPFKGDELMLSPFKLCMYAIEMLCALSCELWIVQSHHYKTL